MVTFSVFNHAMKKVLLYIIQAPAFSALQFCLCKESAVLTSGLYPESMRSLEVLAMSSHYFDPGPDAAYHL